MICPFFLVPLVVAEMLIGVLGTSSRSWQEHAFEAYERSLAMIREELARRPGDPGLERILARVHLRSAHYQEAVNAFQSALERQPRRGALWSGLGRAHLALGETEPAIAAFLQVLALDDDGVKNYARLGLGDAYYQTGEFAKAASSLREAIQAGPQPAETHYRLGRTLDTLARQTGTVTAVANAAVVEARAHLEHAIALDPEHGEAHYVLGRVLTRLEDRAGARRTMEAFRKLSGRAREGLSEEALAESDAVLEAGTAVELARLFFELSEVPRALKYVHRALEIRPDDERALSFRATIFVNTQRDREAVLAYEELLAHHPDHPDGLWNLGRLYLRLGRAQEAGPLLLRAADSRKASPETWETLYEIAASTGLFRGRAEEFARSAFRLRESADNFAHLGTALFEAGKLGESERVLRSGLQRYPQHDGLELALSELRARGGKE